MEQKNIKQAKLHGKHSSRTSPSFRSVPCLSIDGFWLEQAGFIIGQPLKIEIENRKLSIIAL